MTRIEIAVEAMKTLLMAHREPVKDTYVYDPRNSKPGEFEELVRRFNESWLGQCIPCDPDSVPSRVEPNYSGLARRCFGIADAMLAESERLPGGVCR